MKLVLDDEVRRIEGEAIVQRPAPARLGCAVETNILLEAVDMPEEGTGLANPGQAREFIDSSDQEGRQPPIDRLIDGQDGQRPVPAQPVLSQRISRLVGACSFGMHENEFRVNSVPHQGQAFSGAGARLSRPFR